ncbi:MAG TPA: tol-pal system protein YbgF [Burkholderiales bacterium]|nr:tol-pal system protein YbgF [Burkholderiales bacterium]
MRIRFVPFFLGIALTCAAMPSSAALFGDDVARKGVAEQRQRVDALYTRYEELASRLTKLEDAVKASGGQSQQSVLEIANQMQTLRDELRGMRGQLEVLANNIEGNAKRQRDMYVDLDTRLRRFEQSAPPPGAVPPSAPPAGAAPAAPAASGPPPAGVAAAAAAAAAAPPAVDETRAYEAAQGQRRIGNYQAAVAAFQSFVLQYPRSPLAHRAQYWIGDSYYNLRDYKNAIGAQQKLIATYPESESVPDAMLNMASSYIEMGDIASARRTMDNIVARYPSSEAAAKARRRLASLR